MSGGRSWIGKQRELGRRTDEFKQGVIDFLNFAYSHQECVTNGKIKCPCGRCRLNLLQERHVVKVHLSRDEFMPDYTIWHHHGERAPAGAGPTEVLQPQIEVLQPQIEVLQPQIEVLQPTRDLEIQIEEGASKRKDFADVYDKTLGCSKTTAPIVQRRVASKGKDFADVYDKTCRYSKTTVPIVQRRVWLRPTGRVKKGKSVLSRIYRTAIKKFFVLEASSKGLSASRPSTKKPYVSQASSGSTNMERRFMELKRLMELQSQLQTRLRSIDRRLGSIQGQLESLQNQMRDLFDILSAQFHRGSSSSDSTSLDDA